MVEIKIPKQTTLICHGWEYTEFQELMNRHGEEERLTSVPILCRTTLQNAPYKDYKLLMLRALRLLP